MRRVMGALAVFLAVVSCTAVSPGTPRPAPEVRGEPAFTIVTGRDGVAVIDGDRLTRVDGLPEDYGARGPLAAGITAYAAVVIATDRLAVVGPGRDPIVVECTECAGVAVTDQHIVTTRRNHTPGEGFDIVLFDRRLREVRVIPAQRLEEREATDYPAENTASPVTYAADAGGVTVGYLSRRGGVRRGPSVLTRYDYQGTLLDSQVVDGILGLSAVSPDGTRLAVGVGGSGGACITSSVPVVVELPGLRVRRLEPEIPPSARLDPASLTTSWFLLTDLHWRGTALVATGVVHSPPKDETCDPDPEPWQRVYDGRLNDIGPLSSVAARGVGDGCENVVAISADWSLNGTRDGHRGRYGRMALGRPVPAECAPK